jgi:hypothetical protein
VHTAGPTPKSVLSSQRNGLWAAVATIDALGLSDQDRLVWPLPLTDGLAHSVCVLTATARASGANWWTRYAPTNSPRRLAEHPTQRRLRTAGTYRALNGPRTGGSPC